MRSYDLTVSLTMRDSHNEIRVSLTQSHEIQCLLGEAHRLKNRLICLCVINLFALCRSAPSVRCLMVKTGCESEQSHGHSHFQYLLILTQFCSNLTFHYTIVHVSQFAPVLLAVGQFHASFVGQSKANSRKRTGTLPQTYIVISHIYTSLLKFTQF